MFLTRWHKRTSSKVDSTRKDRRSALRFRPRVTRLEERCAPVVNVSQLAGNQSEAAIAIDPTDPDRIFVASNIGFGDGLFAAYSTDGGDTWTYTDPGDGIIADHGDSLIPACCDPSAAFDDFGNLYLSYINPVANAVLVVLSTDGGVTFSRLATVATGDIDQPTVATGPGNTAGTASVWITFADDAGFVAASGALVTGLGQIGAFAFPERAPGSFAGNFGDIAIGPSGEVMVTYQKPTSGQGPAKIFINVDRDGLGPAAFGSRVHVGNTQVGGFDFIPAQKSRGVDAEANLAWDRSGGPHDGRVYLVYTNESPNESNNLNILVRFSDNNGANWSAPIRVNDDTTKRSQFNPAIAVDQTSGFVAVTWHDCRNDDGIGPGSTNSRRNDDAELFGAVSTNGGLTFSANIQISEGPSNAARAANGIDFGDYTSVDFVNGNFYPVWADNSNSTGDNPNGTLGRFDIYTARVSGNV